MNREPAIINLVHVNDSVDTLSNSRPAVFLEHVRYCIQLVIGKLIPQFDFSLIAVFPWSTPAIFTRPLEIVSVASAIWITIWVVVETLDFTILDTHNAVQLVFHFRSTLLLDTSVADEVAFDHKKEM